MKADFASHEVIVSANVSGDPVLSGSVNQVNAIKREFRRAKDSKQQEAIEKRMFIDADIHALNFRVFFDRDITPETRKADRQVSKIAIFAVLYGAQEPNMAQSKIADVYTQVTNEIHELVTKIKEARDNKLVKLNKVMKKFLKGMSS